MDKAYGKISPDDVKRLLKSYVDRGLILVRKAEDVYRRNIQTLYQVPDREKLAELEDIFAGM